MVYWTIVLQLDGILSMGIEMGMKLLNGFSDCMTLSFHVVSVFVDEKWSLLCFGELPVPVVK